MWLTTIGLLLAHLLLPATAAGRPRAAATMLYFRVTPQISSVLVEWATGTEQDHGGFILYRSQTESERGVAIGPGYFEATGGLAGAQYSHTDQEVQAGVTYYYTLISLSLGGEEEKFGPTSATPGQPTSTPTSTATTTGTPGAGATVSATPSATPTASVAATQASNTPAADATATPSVTVAASTPTQPPATATSPATQQPTAAASPTLPPPATPTPPLPAPTADPGLAPPSPPLPETLPPAQGEIGEGFPPVPEPGGAQQEQAVRPPAEQSPPALAQASTPAPTTPTRAARPTQFAQDAAQEENASGLLAVVAVLSLGLATFLAGVMVFLWLRWRQGGA